MTSGRSNYHMLGHATARIEMTRGGREGNNALLHYDPRFDNSFYEKEKDFLLLLQSNISFEMLDHIANVKDSTFSYIKQNGEFAENIYQVVRAGNRKLAGYMIKAYAQYEFNELHRKSLLNDKEGLGKFMPISVTKKAQMNKRITPIHTAAINPNVEYLKVSTDNENFVAKIYMSNGRYCHGQSTRSFKMFYRKTLQKNLKSLRPAFLA